MSLLSLGTSLIGGFLGAKSDKAANKRAKEQLKVDKALADRQIDISKYIEQYAKQAAGLNGAVTDIYGGKTFFNPATGQYETSLGGAQKTIQAASDAEEAARFTGDQAIRREGLNDFERMRDRSARESDTALDDLRNFRRGVGAVDGGRVASQLRASRAGALNAGYDDAERAAQTMQLRTGSSAVGDALSALARDRVRSHATIGTPELEGEQIAQSMNMEREGSLLDKYQMFGQEGRQFYDAGYNPSTYGAEALSRVGDLQKFDLSKLDLAMGGSGAAASTIGNAATGLRQGYLASEANRVRAPMGQFIASAGRAVENEGINLAKMFAGMGGG